MDSLKEIQAPIQKDLEQFQTFFRQSVKSRVPLLNIVTGYILKSKGKQMRPMFIFFSAALTGQINDKTFRAAAMIELLHTATLVHDDVVDEAEKRRGLFSVNALWKNKAAVLVGDFLLSKGLLQALTHKDYDMLEIASHAIKKMSEGELLQMEKTRGLNVDEDIYFDIINAKTASLFAACCACGASSANATEEVIEMAKKFGEAAGMAFQIKDDLFDYQKQNKSGKNHATDIKDKKLTLPLIYLINNASYLDKKKYINIVKNENKNPVKVKYLIDKVYECGGIDYTEKVMRKYYDDALAILNSFPENDARLSLEKLLKFTIERNK